MTNTQNTNENLTVHFKVKDFDAWRTSYQAGDKGRASAGITNGRVFRSSDDPNEVVVLQDVSDVAKARTWLGQKIRRRRCKRAAYWDHPVSASRPRWQKTN